MWSPAGRRKEESANKKPLERNDDGHGKFLPNRLQMRLHISMHSVRESRLNHALQEHGWFCPLFYG